MPHIKKILKTALTVFCVISIFFCSGQSAANVSAASGYEFILLDKYTKTMKIGDTCCLIAITSNGKKPSFSSSNSAVASVNTYGKITAKKSGSATITAKIKNGEASCKVTVEKTAIELSDRQITLEAGESKKLKASASTGHPVTFKSSKSSIASVDENGRILAKKPGTASITATADKTSVKCKVTVRQPSVKLSKSSASLYRKKKLRLSVTSSSKNPPKWKSNKKSVATVDQKGLVTAVKHGSAVITVTVDGVSRTCEITVKKPEIQFEKESLTLTIGESYQTKVTVSSKNKPEYSSSNQNVASVDQNGKIRGKSAGKAYIYAKEDGTKERITVTVKEK